MTLYLYNNSIIIHPEEAQSCMFVFCSDGEVQIPKQKYQ